MEMSCKQPSFCVVQRTMARQRVQNRLGHSGRLYRTLQQQCGFFDEYFPSVIFVIFHLDYFDSEPMGMEGQLLSSAFVFRNVFGPISPCEG